MDSTMRFSFVVVVVVLASALASSATREESCTEDFFPSVPIVRYEGPSSRNPFAYRFYNASESICVADDCRTMSQWLRFSVAYWHSFCGDGSDPFGSPTKSWPWDQGTPMERARNKMKANFEVLDKLGLDYWCFHDRDLAPCDEQASLAECTRDLQEIVDLAKELNQKHQKKVLWGTTQLFKHKRYSQGAATSPDARVFAYAAAQCKAAMDATKALGGENFVFWGGREGYTSLLNTNVSQELEQLAAFMKAAAAYRKEIGFDGTFLIEPKPQEPAAHQYDWDVQTTAHFLLKHGLEDFKINVECNHAQLSGHTCEHELRMASMNGLLGNVDINTGDPTIGWDTDQFLTSSEEATRLALVILEQGGLAPGGLNFDAKLRRESTSVEDLFYAHISGIDAMARGLRQAARIIQEGDLASMKRKRYATYSDGTLPFDWRSASFGDFSDYALKNEDPEIQSANQELFEIVFSRYT